MSSEIDENFKQNGFIKYKDKEKKIIIDLYRRDDEKYHETFEYPFESNVIYKIPKTDLFFIIGIGGKKGDFLHYFTNKYKFIPSNFDAPTRTFLPGITEVYQVYRFMFDYKSKEELLINADANYYYAVSVKNIENEESAT